MYFKTPTIISLLILTAAIKIFSLFPNAVEQYYSLGVYPFISTFQRILTGWLPLSLGDILYAIAAAWILYGLATLVKRMITKKLSKRYLLSAGRRSLVFILLVYIAFNILWGLNYNRLGIGYQLKLKAAVYTKGELAAVMQELIKKLNALNAPAKRSRNQLQRKKQLFGTSVEAYRQLTIKNDLFHYRVSSVKPSIYSYLGNYLGFTGYYNPFSGEAQVNTTVPVFIRPFTTCHEIGHQLGYAKESEANFAGYLSASSSKDPGFLYSVYYDMYAYAGRYLFHSDSVSFANLHDQLSPGVKEDIEELRQFLRSHSNPVENLIDKLYGQFLKANQQPSGKMSYNEVIALLIAYYKEFGKI